MAFGCGCVTPACCVVRFVSVEMHRCCRRIEKQQKSAPLLCPCSCCCFAVLLFALTPKWLNRGRFGAGGETAAAARDCIHAGQGLLALDIRRQAARGGPGCRSAPTAWSGSRAAASAIDTAHQIGTHRAAPDAKGARPLSTSQICACFGLGCDITKLNSVAKHNNLNS